MADLLRLSVLVGFILISLLAGWIGLRSWGLSQGPSTYQTPVVQDLKEKLKNGSLVWQDQGPLRRVRARFMNSQWTLNDDSQFLEDYLADTDIESLLLFYDIETPKALPALRSLFSNSPLKDKTVFCGRADGNLKDLRELEPEWTFCSGEIFMTRFLAFNSLGLASLLKISADVFFIHLKELTPDHELNSVIEEAHRQGKLVLMGPVSRPLNGFEVDGWVVESEDQKAGL